MPGRLSVYNIADLGCNVTKSAIELEDGEVTQAQNIQRDPVGEMGSLRRRDGMAKLNSVAMAGQMTGLVALPLPDLTLLTRNFFVPLDDTAYPPIITNLWRKSTDGTTWAFITSSSGIAQAAQTKQLGTYNGSTAFVPYTVRWPALNNKVYYPGDDYVSSALGTATAPTIHVWDGTNDYVLAKIPATNHALGSTSGEGIFSFVPYSGTQLLVSTYDGNGATGQGRVLLLDVTTGQMVEIGQETNINFGPPVNPFLFQGKVWVATAPTNNSAGKVIKVSITDAAWVTDLTMDAGRAGINGVAFGGNLYVGTAAGYGGSGTMAKIKKRTSDGVWSDAKVIDGAAAPTVIGPIIITGDGLTMLAFWNSGGGGAAPTIRIIKSTDGTTWTQDLDIVGGYGSQYGTSGMPLVDGNNDIYWPIMEVSANVVASSLLLKRTNAGVWSTADGTTTIIRRGPVAKISY